MQLGCCRKLCVLYQTIPPLPRAAQTVPCPKHHYVGKGAKRSSNDARKSNIGITLQAQIKKSKQQQQAIAASKPAHIPSPAEVPLLP